MKILIQGGTIVTATYSSVTGRSANNRGATKAPVTRARCTAIAAITLPPLYQGLETSRLVRI